jgi:hypothetical protein
MFQGWTTAIEQLTLDFVITITAEMDVMEVPP